MAYIYVFGDLDMEGDTSKHSILDPAEAVSLYKAVEVTIPSCCRNNIPGYCGINLPLPILSTCDAWKVIPLYLTFCILDAIHCSRCVNKSLRREQDGGSLLYIQH